MTRDYLSPKVNRDKVEKLCFRFKEIEAKRG